MILVLLKKYFKEYWKILFIVITLTGFGYDYLSMRSEIVDLKVEISRQKEDIKSRDSIISEQDDSIQRMKNSAKEQEERLAKAEIEAEKIRQSYEDEIKDLMEEKVENSPESAKNWLLEKAVNGEFKWQK